MEEYLRSKLQEIMQRGRELPVTDIIFSPPPDSLANQQNDPYVQLQRAHLRRKRLSRHEVKGYKKKLFSEEHSGEREQLKQSSSSPIN